ncbi:MAG: 50S ribosomal protein L5 [Planctomycetes bacterium]|nr:50S ribosomal protein L5 [Planctomycetota bacterium]
MPRLAVRYREQVAPALSQRFGYKNRLAVPRLEKIVINMGMGKAKDNEKQQSSAMGNLAALTGQRPTLRRARKAVSQFHLRAGQPVGCRVTLRRTRMYEFLDRLISVAIPRVRDFRGLNPKSFDGRGNYTMGISEQTVFVEVRPDTVEAVQGMDVTFVTTARTDEEGFALLQGFGMPFRKERDGQEVSGQ